MADSTSRLTHPRCGARQLYDDMNVGLSLGSFSVMSACGRRVVSRFGGVSALSEAGVVPEAILVPFQAWHVTRKCMVAMQTHFSASAVKSMLDNVCIDDRFIFAGRLNTLQGLSVKAVQASSVVSVEQSTFPAATGLLFALWALALARLGLNPLDVSAGGFTEDDGLEDRPFSISLRFAGSDGGFYYCGIPVAASCFTGRTWANLAGGSFEPLHARLWAGDFMTCSLVNTFSVKPTSLASLSNELQDQFGITVHGRMEMRRFALSPAQLADGFECPQLFGRRFMKAALREALIPQTSTDGVQVLAHTLYQNTTWDIVTQQCPIIVPAVNNYFRKGSPFSEHMCPIIEIHGFLSHVRPMTLERTQLMDAERIIVDMRDTATGYPSYSAQQIRELVELIGDLHRGFSSPQIDIYVGISVKIAALSPLMRMKGKVNVEVRIPALSVYNAYYVLSISRVFVFSIRDKDPILPYPVAYFDDLFMVIRYNLIRGTPAGAAAGRYYRASHRLAQLLDTSEFASSCEEERDEGCYEISSDDDLDPQDYYLGGVEDTDAFYPAPPAAGWHEDDFGVAHYIDY